jgi:GNAT superfamily N-acetyltransferase
MSAPALDVYPLTPDRWADFEALFNTMGKHAGCWCMWWRIPNKEWDAGEGNKQRMHNLVMGGVEPGLLGYLAGAPIAWVSLAPRTDYQRFARASANTFQSPDDKPVWSIVCFYVHPDFRRQGVSSVMLQAAIDYARGHGATLLESYPNDPRIGKKRAASDLNMGTIDLFDRAGFVEVARNHPVKPIMRLEVANQFQHESEAA